MICGTPLEACRRTSYTIQVACASGKASAVVEVQVLVLKQTCASLFCFPTPPAYRLFKGMCLTVLKWALGRSRCFRDCCGARPYSAFTNRMHQLLFLLYILFILFIGSNQFANTPHISNFGNGLR